MNGEGAMRVAIVPWGNPFEVYLDPLGKSLDDFCRTMTGGWLFGFAKALTTAGHRPTIVLISRAVGRTTCREHEPTGTPMVIIPAPRRSTLQATCPGLRRDLHEYLSSVPRGLLAELRRHDAVLVQEYEDQRCDVLAWWGRAVGLPVFASFQGGFPPWEAAPLQRLLRPVSMRRLRGLLIGDRAERDRVVRDRRVEHDRLHHVLNPVDLDEWRPRDRAAARVVGVSSPP
jgi:hypothetical protein